MAHHKLNPLLSPFIILPLLWLTLVMFCAFFAEFLPLPDPDAADWQQLAAKPGSVGKLQSFNEVSTDDNPFYYWLGSDTMGRDVLTRIIFGARISLAIGFLSPLVGLLLGGTLAGYYPI